MLFKKGGEATSELSKEALEEYHSHAAHILQRRNVSQVAGAFALAALFMKEHPADESEPVTWRLLSALGVEVRA